ncbi:hypothetical protein QLX08_002571 [Tetragonisca angustula]|uniref:Uncharacterized protein n=1 Tax=Tetragonisca angustula TaxID=166442 RepID=A0AAW1ACV1_9HYME
MAFEATVVSAKVQVETDSVWPAGWWQKQRGARKGRTPFSRVVVIDVRPYVASRFQWGHVIGRLRQWWRSTGWFACVPSLSVLSVLGRGPPLYVRTYAVESRTTAISFSLPACAPRFTVHVGC